MRSVIADATNEAYAVRIAKGAGLIAETRELLRAWQPGESAAVLAERVLKMTCSANPRHAESRTSSNVCLRHVTSPQDVRLCI